MITTQRTAADKVGQTIQEWEGWAGGCPPAFWRMICTFQYSRWKCSAHRVPAKSLLRKLSWLFLPSISCFVCFLKWHILTDDWEIFSKLDTTWLELDQSVQAVLTVMTVCQLRSCNHAAPTIQHNITFSNWLTNSPILSLPATLSNSLQFPLLVTFQRWEF